MSKRTIVTIIAVLVMCGVVYAIEQVYTTDTFSRIVQPGQTHTAQNGWFTLASVASAGDEPNDLAVGERTYATVAAAIVAAASGDGKIVIYGDSYAERANMLSCNVMCFRCTGITDAANIVWSIYLGTLETGDTDCALAYAGELDFTVGTQASLTSGYEFADTLVVTDGDWVKTWGSSNPENNRVAEAAIDLMGADLIVAVPTAAACNCKLLMKGY